MRVKPAPGTYLVTMPGDPPSTFPVVFTEEGATSYVYRFGYPIPVEWEWFELNGGPCLKPVDGVAADYVGFGVDGQVDAVFLDGSTKEGSYGPA